MEWLGKFFFQNWWIVIYVNEPILRFARSISMYLNSKSDFRDQWKKYRRNIVENLIGIILFTSVASLSLL